MFLLYDYSFRPPHVKNELAISWAEEDGVMCADEFYIQTEPYESIVEWCHRRVELTYQLLRKNQDDDYPYILINHFPLKYELAIPYLIPRFSIWCGTNKTENWHREFLTHSVVSGHLHMRTNMVIDEVRFKEVSLGYGRHWDQFKGPNYYLRKII